MFLYTNPERLCTYRLNISVVIVREISFHRCIFLHHSRENVYRTKLLTKNADCKSFCTLSLEIVYISFEYFSCN